MNIEINKENEPKPFSPFRILIFLAILLIFSGYILYRFAFVAATYEPAPPNSNIITERGPILDRNGKVLALQTLQYNLGISLNSVTDKEKLKNILSPIIDMSPEEIQKIFDNANPVFSYIKKGLSQIEADLVEEALSKEKIGGTKLETVTSRTYPEQKLASHVIGFMGTEAKGLEGIELYLNDVLEPDFSTGSRTAYGNQVFLTIDANLQYSLEQMVQKSMDKTQAETTMLLVTDAKSGEILSYISNPAPNLNEYPSATPEEKENRPARYAYEPGSVFKIFSTAAVMELGGITDSTRYSCDGIYTYKSPLGEEFSIKCMTGAHGFVGPRQVLQYSCNDGMSQISETVTSSDFEKKLRELGFGQKTGIEQTGETAGLFRSSKKWSLRSKPTIAIGQEISVSALQMVSAATTLANGGNRLQLTLVSKIQNHDGKTIYSHKPEIKSTPLSPETVNHILSYMETTAVAGSGTRANVGDVPMGVKTGTAQMIDKKTGKYSDTDIISSCMALFPANNPEIIIYAVIIKAKGSTTGARIAAPLVKDAADLTIDYLAMSREKATSITHEGIIYVPSKTNLDIGTNLPDFSGLSKRMLSSLLEKKEFKVLIHGEGYVKSQKPPAGTPVKQGMTIELYLE